VWHSNRMTLDIVQARVLGTLIEKEIVTPENYPLSLNALIAGCNQKSSREPVMELQEEQVRQALHALGEQQLTSVVRDARVPKFEHRARTVLNLRRDETAVLCLLLLRGPQTAGELRSRADRMYSFDDIAGVESTINRLMSSPEAQESSTNGIRPLVEALPRQPGSREIRYMHLLCGTVQQDTRYSESATSSPVPPKEELAARIAELEMHMESLQSMMRRLEERLQNQGSSSQSSNGFED
jgi:uncharacterized protein YceH (UPF0502 family)